MQKGAAREYLMTTSREMSGGVSSQHVDRQEEEIPLQTHHQQPVGQISADNDKCAFLLIFEIFTLVLVFSASNEKQLQSSKPQEPK